MSLTDFLFGKSGSIESLPTMSKEQEALFQQLLGGLGGPLESGLGNLQQILSGDPAALEAFQAPMMRQFNEQTIPGIGERFSGLGAGAQGSSAFAQTLGQAGAGLQENLAAQKAQLQQGAMGQLSSLLGLGIQTPTFERMQIPGTQGMMQPLMQGLGQMGGMALGGGGMGMLGGIGFQGGIKKLLGM